jgi:thiamine-monophosphate kinase
VLPAGADVILGPGDDAAVLRAPDRRVVATTDMLIEGRHFRREWSGPADIGHKAAARNLADIAAMGARPTGLLVAFAGPGSLKLDWLLELVRGIADECSQVGAGVAGGDTSSSDTIMLAVTALGDLAGGEPVTRAGARPSDVVAVAGSLGSAAAGLALLSAGLGNDAASLPELAGLIVAHRRPAPPYGLGPQAARLGATSMIDVSDGLVADLGHIAKASDVRIELESAVLGAQPVARAGALEQASALLAGSGQSGGAGHASGGAVHAGGAGQSGGGSGRARLRWVLTGGDDHALAATFPAGTALPQEWTIVGRAAEGRGVAVDGRIWTDAGGWDHFGAPT